MRTFVQYSPDQSFILPPSPSDWLPEGHLAYFISDVVSELNLSAFFAKYDTVDGRGSPPFHPAMMVNLLVYAYCTGKPSSRKIERATYEEVPFRVLAAGHHPDHSVISAFRQRHLRELADIFGQVLRIAMAAGLVRMGHVALDGSKVKANASKHKAMSYERLVQAEQSLTAEVAEMLAAAAAADNAEDQANVPAARGGDVPPELRRRQGRLEKIRQAKAFLEKKAKDDAAARAAEFDQRQAEREAKEAETGKKSGGRKPGRPDPETAVPEPKAQQNFTDPESRIMVDGATKGFDQCYNAQIVVDSDRQIIIAADVTQQANDKLQLVPMVKQAVENTGTTPQNLSADAGYFSQEALSDPVLADIQTLVPPSRQKHGESCRKATATAPEDSAPQGQAAAEPPTADGATLARLVDRMRARLASQAGHAIYRMRKAIVEPVFGQIKQIRGFRRFSFRGLDAVQAEWRFICATHNLLKLFRAGVSASKIRQIG